MNKKISLIFTGVLIFLLLGNVFFYNPVRATSFAIPQKVIDYLNKKYKGWKYPNTSGKVLEYFNKNKIKMYPNYITGDFNGDGILDCAIQISTSGSQVSARYIAIAFLEENGKMKPYILEDNINSPYIYLWFFKKGDKDYDYEKSEKFVYKNDSIGVISYGESGRSYLYENGKFKMLWTSD